MNFTSKHEAAEFVEEVEDILGTIKAVKGPAYMNGLCLILNVLNFAEAMGLMLRASSDTEDKHTYAKIAAMTTADVMHRVCMYLCHGDEEELIVAKMKELSADLDSITNKQAEYSRKKGA